MSIAAPIFHAAGYEIEDASLYMGIMANNGIEASVAANSLKTGFAKLVSPAKEGQVWLDRLGVSITNADGSMKDSLTVQKDLHNAFATLSESEQMAAASAIFGKNQMAPWLALINTGTDDVNKLNSAIAGSNGLAQKMADDMMGGFAGSLKRLSSSWDVFLNTLGEKLAPYIGKVVNVLQKATDALNGMSDEQFDALIKIVAGFAALGPALVVIGKITTGIGTMVSAVGKIGKAMKGVSSIGGFLAKLVGPGGWIALIIAAVVLIGVMVWKNWDKIKPIFEQVKTAIQPIIETIKEVAMSIFTSLQPAFEKIGNIISQNIGPITEQFKALLNSFMPVFQIIAQGVADLITVLGPVVSYLLQQLGPAISAIINLILLVVQNVLEQLLPLVQPIMQVLTGLIEFITGVFTGDWKAAWQGIVDIFSGIFNGIKSICKSVINSIIKSINGVLKGINGISIPDWVPGVGGASLKIPLIPQLAKGTDNWAGGVAQISERGGEIVDLPSGSRVYPHDETVKMAYQDGASTGKTVNVSIPKIADTIVVREDADIDKIVNKLAKQLTEAAASLGSASLNSAGKATPTLAAANTM
jgi:phage-related protein